VKGTTVTLTQPTDPLTLATAVADVLVVASDQRARDARTPYWDRGRDYARAVLDAVWNLDDVDVPDLTVALLADIDSPRAYAALRGALVRLASGPLSRPAELLFTLAWQAECNSRLGFRVGARYDDLTPHVSAERLAALPAPAGSRTADDPDVLVVIPFRDRDAGGERLRNLLACLHALADQSVPRSRYRLVVVESDAAPRWRDLIEPLVDRYLFAYNPGRFNKPWAVNAGVVHASGRPQAICVLDADVLADRDFVGRNARRFAAPGTMGHRPYRDVWCLDEASTSWAITERLHRGRAGVAAEHLRAYVLRRAPGCCVWVRPSAFHRVGGMDERRAGWGGEDDGFAYRLDRDEAFDSYDDVLLHMYHPASTQRRDDGGIDLSRVLTGSWDSDARIGDLQRFALA
jgi:hypothetical protein